MSEWEKEDAFESLRVSLAHSTILASKYLIVIQKSKKAHERGEAIRQYESRSGEIISLVDEDEEQSKAEKKSLSGPRLFQASNIQPQDPKMAPL
jgi:hypothetical protein